MTSNSSLHSHRVMLQLHDRDNVNSLLAHLFGIRCDLVSGAIYFPVAYFSFRDIIKATDGFYMSIAPIVSGLFTAFERAFTLL